MKNAEVQVGVTYMARVSGRMVPVLVLSAREREKTYYGGYCVGPEGYRRTVTEYRVRNLVTGREITVSAARLRPAVSVRSCDMCRLPIVAGARWYRDNREDRVLCAACADVVRAERRAARLEAEAAVTAAAQEV